MAPDRRVLSWQELLEQQSGVLSRRQALAGGMSPDAWRWRLRSGRWQGVAPGVAVAHSGGMTDEERGWAAVLYVGVGAHLTGDSALRSWGMSLPEPPAWRVAAHGRHLVAPLLGRTRAGQLIRIQPHRVARLHQVVHPTRRPPTVRPAAAVLHAAAWASSDRAAEWRVAAAVQQRIVTPAQIRQAQQVLTRTARRALVRLVLDDVALGAHARSELDMLAFLREHQLPLPDRMQLAVRVGRQTRYLDAYWEQRRVSVEMDGSAHMQVGPWEADLLRANLVAVAHRSERLLLLRFTPGQLRHDGARSAALLRDALL